MPQLLSNKLIRRDYPDGRVMLQYWCQGCEELHSIWAAGGEPGKAWTWNGDAERPVFSPSVLTRSGHYAYDTPRDTCWCTYNAEQKAKGEKPSSFECTRCHTFVGCNGAQPGEVIFLGDCTHALAGKTLPLPDIPEHMVAQLQS